MMSRYVRIFCLIFLVLAQFTFAGTTGKIAGTITDKETGDPLPGANIIIEGTTMGAASDIEGNYTVLFVPPGTYNLSIMMMGYSKQSIQNVRVQIDQTARVNVALSIEALAGEEVTVVAEKKVVKEDVATSVVAVSAEEVDMLPMTTVSDVVELQAGVEDGMVIRGGGADEALFQVDGITLRDPRNNQPITGIALSAVQEISIERGGFNAEYGQVRSGLVNVVTKEGYKDKYTGAFSIKASSPQAKHFGVSPFDANSMWMRPFLDDEVAWIGTLAGWDPHIQHQYPQFDGWNKISERLMSDDDPTNDLTPAAAQELWKWRHRRAAVTDQADYNFDVGFGGPVPFVSDMLGDLRFFTSYRQEREMLLIPLSRDDYLARDFSFQLTSDINQSMKLKLSTMLGTSYNVAINATDNQFNSPIWGRAGVPYWSPTDYMRSPFTIAKITDEQRSGRIFSDSWYCPAQVDHQSFAAKFRHMINPTTFYEASLEHIARQYLTEPIEARDTDTEYEIIPGVVYANEAPFGFSSETTFGNDGMFFGGHTSTARDYSETSATTFKVDLSSQVNFRNLIKTGFEFVYNDLNLHYGEVNNFVGSKTIVKSREFPIRTAFYIQDKLEYDGFIINMGVRADYTNSNTDWVNLGVFDKTYFSSKYDSTQSYKSEKIKGQWAFSPRLGISHPITETSKLFFNYGHFKQLPTYDTIFRVGRGSSGGMNMIGDPSLILAKTIQYELGYDHNLFNDYLVQLSAFYHDISDQQDFTTYISADASVNYYKANNNSYEDVRGLELTFRKSAGQWLTGFANYTYRVSTRGHFGTAQVYEDPGEQREYNRQTSNLYQERPIPTPYARASLTFHTPADFGPQVMGEHIAGRWSLNVIGDWREGEWITWNPNQIRSVAQNLQVTNWYNFSLKLNKTFNLPKIQLTVFAEVENLFNTKHLSGAGFYSVNDQIAYLESLHLPKNDAWNNMVGEDKAGDYRKDGVAFQPMEQIGSISGLSDIQPAVIYYALDTKQYMQYVDGNWEQVSKGRVNQVLDDKAYIDMPNQTSFNFLNPRQIFFGIRVNF